MNRTLAAMLIALAALACAPLAEAGPREGRPWGNHDNAQSNEQRGPGPQGGDHGRRDWGDRDGWKNRGDWKNRDGEGWKNRTGDWRAREGDWRDRDGYRRREHDRAREGVVRGRLMPLEQLENRIGAGMRGYRIGNPALLMFGGRPVYRIRWRTPEGRILIVLADAETGQILDVRGRR